MNTKAPLTYQFPIEKQREYFQLIKSKEDFSKKLTNAEQHKLEILYAQLHDAWNQNRSETLNAQLQQKYIELREIQRTIDYDLAKFEMIVEAELKIDIEQKLTKLIKEEQDLTSEEKNFEQEKKKRRTALEMKKENLNGNIQLWKEDIILKEENLKQKSMNLTREENLLKAEEKKLEDLLNQKNLLIKKKEETSNSLDSLLTQHSNYLKNQREKLQIALNKREEKLKQEEEPYQKNLKDYEETLRNQLKEFENKQLEKLREELSMEVQRCPEDLKNYFLIGDYLSVSKAKSMIARELNQRRSALKRDLTKIGVSEERFFELMSQNSSR